MVATTMPSIDSLIRKLSTDFPAFTFAVADDFSWSPDTKRIFYNPTDDHADALLLHELSHGILGHTNYSRDVELLDMESAAWEKAKEISSPYDITIDATFAEDNIDTYRDWLHARSTCPNCNATGFQVLAHTYECPACTHRWRVNEARVCALRRYSQK